MENNLLPSLDQRLLPCEMEPACSLCWLCLGPTASPVNSEMGVYSMLENHSQARLHNTLKPRHTSALLPVTSGHISWESPSAFSGCYRDQDSALYQFPGLCSPPDHDHICPQGKEALEAVFFAFLPAPREPRGGAVHTLASYVTAKSRWVRPGLRSLPGLIHIPMLFGRFWFCFNFIFETESHYVAQAVLNLTMKAGFKLSEIFLLLPPECWD